MGAVARTATNVQANARSPIATIVHAAVLVLVLVTLAPLVSMVPLCGLAGMLLVICWNMAAWSEWGSILRARTADAMLLPITFGMTVLIDLTVAIEVGVILGMFLFVRRMSAAAHLAEWDARADADFNGGPPLSVPDGVAVYEVRGPFFFGIAHHLRELLNRIQRRPRVLILRMRYVPFIDTTAAAALRGMVRGSRSSRIALLLSGVQPAVMETLRDTGIHDELGPDRIYTAFDAALEAARGLVAASPPTRAIRVDGANSKPA
jgi:SulP family sulfate permease